MVDVFSVAAREREMKKVEKDEIPTYSEYIGGSEAPGRCQEDTKRAE